jgi:hypothetical protein
MEELPMCGINWRVRHQDKIDKFTVEYPFWDENRKKHEPGLPEFIKINIDGRNAYLKTKKLDGGKTLADVKEMSLVKWEECNRYSHYLYKLWNDKEQKIAFIGLTLAILGLLIDAAFDIGKGYPLIEYRHLLFAVMKILSWILKVFGLGLVFWKGFISAK